MKILILALSIAHASCPNDNFVDGKLKFGKYSGNGANGRCVSPIQPDEQAKIDWVMKRLNIKRETDGDQREFHAAAEVFHAMDSLGDGSFQYHKGASLKFEDHVVRRENGKNVNKYFSTCAGKTLIMRKSGCQATFAMDKSRNRFSGRNNTQHIAHEFGHCIGHMSKNGETIYDLYKSRVAKGACQPTWYAAKNYAEASKRNEEFAEVFSLYLTDPDQLHLFASCEPAFRFFAELFGEKIPDTGVKSITCKSRAEFFQNEAAVRLQNHSAGTAGDPTGRR